MYGINILNNYIIDLKMQFVNPCEKKNWKFFWDLTIGVNRSGNYLSFPHILAVVSKKRQMMFIKPAKVHVSVDADASHLLFIQL